MSIKVSDVTVCQGIYLTCVGHLCIYVCVHIHVYACLCNVYVNENKIEARVTIMIMLFVKLPPRYYLFSFNTTRLCSPILFLPISLVYLVKMIVFGNR